MAPKTAVGGGPATLQQKSPAEFFAENKNIAGFDNVRSMSSRASARNACRRARARSHPACRRTPPPQPPLTQPPSPPQPGKCLYTTVRELVENSLDSAESVSALPLIEITM
jgi:hypothetical protein